MARIFSVPVLNWESRFVFDMQGRAVASDEWYTPLEIIQSLGEFDLDPCAPMKPLWQTARVMINKEQDGLSKEWKGRVWLNPPYQQSLITQFMRRMGEHKNGIALVFAKIDSRMFRDHIYPNCDSICLLRKRIRFYNEQGQQPASPNNGNMLIAYTPEDTDAILRSGLDVQLLRPVQ